jgi:hypothetical protein
MPTLRERIAEAATNCRLKTADCGLKIASCRSQSSISNLHSPQSTISVCFAAANENDYIVPTIASVKCDCPRAEIIGVDDVSEKPQPACRIRTGRRMGVSGARRLACQLAGGDVIAFIDPHIALDSESAQAIWKIALAEAARAGRQIKTLEVPAPPCKALDAQIVDWDDCRYQIENLKSAVRTPQSSIRSLHSSQSTILPRGKLDALARLALDRRAIVYPRCWSLWTAHNGARFHVDGGLRRHIWRLKAPQSDPEPTSCCLGGLYVMPRELLEAFGGWPKLPAPYAGDEETLSMLAIAHGVEILLAPNIAIWHLFRGHKPDMVPVPFGFSGEAYWHNCAAAYRLILDDAHWKTFRPLLGRAVTEPDKDGKPKTRPAISEAWLKDVEADAFTRYRDSVQKNFKLSTEEILAELDRRMMADLQPGEKA